MNRFDEIAEQIDKINYELRDTLHDLEEIRSDYRRVIHAISQGTAELVRIDQLQVGDKFTFEVDTLDEVWETVEEAIVPEAIAARGSAARIKLTTDGRLTGHVWPANRVVLRTVAP